MIIPAVPNGKVLDGNNMPTPQWRVFFTSLINQMQHFVSDESTILPSQPTTNLTKFSDDVANKAKFVGAVAHDSTALNMKVKTEAGKDYKPLSTYEELSTVERNAIPSGKRNGRMIKDTTDNDTYLGTGDTFKKITLT